MSDPIPPDQQLRDDLMSHEVETMQDILTCMRKPPTASKFRRLLLLFLRGHYASAENYGEEFEHLGCYTWTDDPLTSKLTIEFSHQAVDRKPNATPAIYVRFGGVTLEKLGLGGNFAGQTFDSSGTHVSKAASLQLVVAHVANRATDAYDMAEMSSRVTSAMATPLALNSGATSFEVEGYAEPRKKNPEQETNYLVEMRVSIGYTHSVTRHLESHRLRRLALTAQSDS